MKVRNGFVSNSSSSSFCIFGACLDSSEARELVKDVEDLKDAGLYDIREYLEEKTPLSIYVPPDFGMLYIGRDWDSVKDDETGKQFKENVKDELKKLAGKDLDCGTQSEAWYG